MGDARDLKTSEKSIIDFATNLATKAESNCKKRILYRNPVIVLLYLLQKKYMRIGSEKVQWNNATQYFLGKKVVASLF